MSWWAGSRRIPGPRGKRVWPTGQAILGKRVREPIPHLRTLRPELPEFLEQAVTRCLAKSPADRFSTAAEFAAALIPGASRPTVPVSRWRARRRVALLAGVA